MKNYYSFILLKIIIALLLIPQSVFSQNSNRVDVSDNANLIGYNNVRYGYNSGSLMGATGGSSVINSANAFIGHSAGANSNGTLNFQNYGNTFVGISAGANNSTGSNNAFIGNSAGFYNKAAIHNLFMGSGSGVGNGSIYTAGSYNTGLGSSSLSNITTGTNNVALGYFSLAATTTNNLSGTYNIGVGDNAGRNTSSGNFNIFIGKSAGFASIAASLTGDNNIVVGQEAGFKLNTCSENILLGLRSGYNLITSSGNVFIGNNSGYSQTTVIGANNTYVGNSAGLSNVSGINNTFFGQNAGYYYKSNRNTFVGSNSGYGDVGNASGDDNTYLGYSAGGYSYGSSNTLLGSFAGFGLNGGTSNIFIGRSTGIAVSSGFSNVFIGTYAGSLGVNAATISNSIAIGNNAKSVRNNTISLGDTSVSMQVGIGTNWPIQRLTIKGNVAFVAYNDGMFYKNKRFLFQDEQENIALGTEHDHDIIGKENLLIGVGANIKQKDVNNATAIGHGATVAVSNGFVIGNEDVRVGIGTSSPTARLEVASGIDGESGFLFTNLKDKNQNQHLSVNEKGEVVLQKSKIKINYLDEWSDKVFEKDYTLKSLSEVEDFVKINKHLSNIPSAKEMTETGIDSDKFSAKLLEKIEELTLYLIEMKKENEVLKNRVSVLEIKK